MSKIKNASRFSVHVDRVIDLHANGKTPTREDIEALLADICHQEWSEGYVHGLKDGERNYYGQPDHLVEKDD